MRRGHAQGAVLRRPVGAPVRDGDGLAVVSDAVGPVQA